MSAEGWEPARVKERLDAFFEVYVAGLTTEIGDGRNVITLPGVAALVERLDQSTVAVQGLVTGNIEEGARVKLLPTGLWPRFQIGAFGSDHMDRRRLPSLAARRAHALLGTAFSPREVIVIGDTPHDIDCARAFGAVAVAVATGQHSRDELLAERPDLFFDNLGDVDKVLAALLGG
jgi:phosphoglycolate phosphatase-like HAD superfamily hydrolase